MSLIDSVRRARIVQVMVVYSGTSWAILEFAGMLHEFFRIPGWLRHGRRCGASGGETRGAPAEPELPTTLLVAEFAP